MAGGLTLLPSYTQDQIFPAYQDRLLIKSLGIQAGVVGEEDFKVSAATGLQVALKKGKAFVEQTSAKQESSNAFYNGLYNVLSPAEQAPYNSVEVPTTNPQIAQIILRVYDVEELGTTGSSFGRIEWLNGTANAGATAAHVEEGKESEFGAAVLPTSSFRCASIIVPKNATVSSEYTIIDRRPGRWIKATLGTLVENAPGNEVLVRSELGGTRASLKGTLKVKATKSLTSGSNLITALPAESKPIFFSFQPVYNYEKNVFSVAEVGIGGPINYRGETISEGFELDMHITYLLK